MSYFTDRIRFLPVAFLILAIYVALPNSFTQHWGDATYLALSCLGIALYLSPETYFRCRISKRNKRNLVVNWIGMLASTAVAAAYAQHESANGQVVRWRHGNVPRGVAYGYLVFVATYFLLWLAYRMASRERVKHH